MRILTPFIALCTFLAGPLQAQDLPTIRVAVLKVGIVNWELATTARNGFDEKHGFKPEVLPYADNGATRIAVEGVEPDVAVANWIWVARQHTAGKASTLPDGLFADVK